MISFSLLDSNLRKGKTQMQLLLSEIDSKLESISYKNYNKARIGESTKDYSYDYQELVMLRSIALKKVCGDDCFSCYKTEDITTLITKLLYKIC